MARRVLKNTLATFEVKRKRLTHNQLKAQEERSSGVQFGGAKVAQSRACSSPTSLPGNGDPCERGSGEFDTGLTFLRLNLPRPKVRGSALDRHIKGVNSRPNRLSYTRMTRIRFGQSLCVRLFVK
jgi:hypothetical protein